MKPQKPSRLIQEATFMRAQILTPWHFAQK
jgi:hypothetical protein